MIERLDHLERAGGIALTLRRAWARSATHLLLEYLDERGAIVPGQWMADPEETKRRVEATRDRAPEAGVEWIESTGVLLQPGGADRKLRGIPTLLREPGTVLLSHRPERRAVVQRAGGRFTKVLRPGRAEAMVDGLERLTTALAGGQCRVPTLTDVDVAAGHVTCAALPGRSMDDVLDESGRAPAAARAAGVALRHLHDADLPAPDHAAAAERALLAEQIDRLDAFAPAAAAACRAALPPVEARLADAPGRRVLIHRDFYDKQVFFDERTGPGLLDFDTLARGEAALDVGNMLAHLELRVMQGRCRSSLAVVASDAFLDTYHPDAAVVDRVPAYLDASRLRLACLYAYRPRWRELTGRLLERLGTPATTMNGGRT